MPTLSTPQKNNVLDLQTKLATAKSALKAASDAAGAVMSDMYSVGTTDALIAGNAAMAMQGVLVAARGQVITAHAVGSTALLAYDATQGGVIVTNGAGAR